MRKEYKKKEEATRAVLRIISKLVIAKAISSGVGKDPYGVFIDV